MKTKKVLILPGDGIGREVCDAALPVLTALNLPIELEYGDIGWECWKKEGDTVPQDTWDKIARSDAVLLGAITSKGKKQAEKELPEHLQGTGHKFVSPVIQLRQKLGLFANVRPSYYISGQGKPFNMAVIRENTEGLYAGFDYHGIPEQIQSLLSHPNIDKSGFDNSAITLRLQTKFGLTRLFKFAFEYAVKHGHKRVTFADKPNVMRDSGAFAEEVLDSVAANYPEIEYDIQNVDAMALWLATRPEQFGVIVAENMFGDILSDLAGGVMGGLGLAPSANYGEGTAYFEPVHGSAPSMYGKNKANPSAMFLSIALMLDYLGFEDAAEKIRVAVQETIRKSKNLTYDFGGDASTSELAAQIIDNIENNKQQLSAAIITVGDELLAGEYHNTNLKEISEFLQDKGYHVAEHLVCSDQKSMINRAVNKYVGAVDLLVVSGGLGPTSDDVTRYAVASALSLPVEFNEQSWQHICNRMSSFKLEVCDKDKVQAYFPQGATTIANSAGIAQGFTLTRHNTEVLVLPGPPKEMSAVLNKAFENRQSNRIAQHSKHQWKLLGVTETQINVLIEKLAPAIAKQVKYIWRYPYLNVSVNCDDSQPEVIEQLQAVTNSLEAFTVSRNGLNASQMIEATEALCWKSDDVQLEELLQQLPGNGIGPTYYVNTIPAISDVLSTGSFDGTLEIHVQAPDGEPRVLAIPLRDEYVTEYVKEFASWCYLTSES
ncbi:isocitrate/isopropylmalate dehydrogenase family protein [Pseudoalteromonas sp. T1lg23B]|uniref:isocitrate/isopropylmalate dehydrogenase family protein n=1 Tax=Pseudoalteromonas sp. T1lg23B TaxID=2077097 RepID=UPI000CF67268|nr:isocitrate/isopropylmalate dehydrogenase family protein [Pseudoalteromonas sp. T1lg23B]